MATMHFVHNELIVCNGNPVGRIQPTRAGNGFALVILGGDGLPVETTALSIYGLKMPVRGP